MGRKRTDQSARPHPLIAAALNIEAGCGTIDYDPQLFR